MNGKAIKSCSIVAMQPRADILTLEGRGQARRHAAPMQARSREPRPAMRLLHAGHGDERADFAKSIRPTEEEVRAASKQSVPLTHTTSSRASWPARARWQASHDRFADRRADRAQEDYRFLTGAGM